MYISYRTKRRKKCYLRRPLKGFWCDPWQHVGTSASMYSTLRLLIALDKLLRKSAGIKVIWSASIKRCAACRQPQHRQACYSPREEETNRQGNAGGHLAASHSQNPTIADVRGCSMNQLVNSGLLAYYSKGRRGKLDGSSRAARGSSMATYDKMSAVERQQLMQVLGSLTGLQEGPKEGFPDGTRYEYDFAPQNNCRSYPSGERFPWL